MIRFPNSALIILTCTSSIGMSQCIFPLLDTASVRPVAFKKSGNNVLDEELTADPYPTWQKLEELVDKGKIRNIGISK